MLLESILPIASLSKFMNSSYNPLDPLGLGSSGTIQTPPPPQQNTNYTTIQAYTIKNGQFHRMRIKILEKGRNIYVNSYHDRNTNMWYSANNAIAQQTSQYDPDVIYNNFDYKVNISGLGYVYFYRLDYTFIIIAFGNKHYDPRRKIKSVQHL